MKNILLYTLLFFGVYGFSQEASTERYREDQFYFGVTYNFLENKPEGMSQQGLSGGVHLGFIRDFPLNKKGTIALGAGLGYSRNSYNHNLYINETAGVVDYQILNGSVADFSENKLNTHEVVFPIQFRFRTSTIDTYKFWRFYTGVKFIQVFDSVVRYKGELGDVKQHNTPDLNKSRLLVDIGFGYNTWNFYVAYGLEPLFLESAKVNDRVIATNEIQIGLMFYLF